MTRRKIFFLVPYPFDEAPSQRFRFEQYFQFLEKEGFQYSVRSFLSQNNWRSFYNSGKTIQKINALLTGFIKRAIVLIKIIQYDFIFIHREVAPIGPPVFEWIIAKVLRKKIIYDFDDAIWMTDKTNESWLEKTIRWRGKVKWICKWSYKVSCGNDYLCDYAARFNRNVVMNPTTIDTEKVHNSKLHSKVSDEKIIIGWTGSHSTIKYLNEIEPTLQQLEQRYSNLEFWVIADRPPDFSLPRLQFKPWSKESEIKDLAQFDIGLMPLPDDEWTKGKCGFKALQYMALSIPTIASAVGVNNRIIKHGENGYLASHSDWEELMVTLIENKQLRAEIGNEGRKTVEDFFSVESNKATFLSLFS